MKNKKGFTLVELLSVIVLLGIIVTIGIFSVSSIRKTILDRQYKNIKTEIELAAEKYYADTENTQVYVDTLIKEGYLKADNKSMIITDPRDKTSLNCHIVTINDNEDGNLGTESNIDESGNCNEDAIVNSEISIVDTDGNKINKTWYKSPITLKVKFNNSEKDPNSYEYTWKSEKNPNIISDEKTYNLEVPYNERGYVVDDEFYVTLVNAEETLESKGQRVRIDGVLPVVKSLEIPDKDTWTKEKTLKVNLTDIGSGIDGYIFSKDDCEKIDLDEYTKIDVANPNDVKIEHKITENGTYTFCASDKAGNIIKHEETIVIDKVDDVPPVCSYIENTSWTKNNVAISFGCVDNESGCAKLTYKNATTNCTGASCYKTYTYTSTYKAANISSTIGTFTIEDNAGNKVTCPRDKKEVNVYLDKTNPVINSVTVNSNNTNYNSIYTTVTIKTYDSHSDVKEVCASNSNSYSSCSWVNISKCSKSGNIYTCNISLTINADEGSGASRTVYAYAKDNAGNIQSKTTNYKLYTTCTDTNFNGYGDCSKKCGGGYKYEYRTDKYLGTSCNGYGNVSCNTFSCCTSTYERYYYSDYCDASCGWGSQRTYYKYYSNYDDSYCGINYVYENCYDDSGCYEPDPDPDPNPGGDGSSCLYDVPINADRCLGSTRYHITYCQDRDCPDAQCMYDKVGNSSSSGYVTRSSLGTNLSNCPVSSGGGGSSGGGSGGGSSGGGSSSSGRCEDTPSNACWYKTWGECVSVEGYNCIYGANKCYCSDH